jgi:hypothetical protein
MLHESPANPPQPIRQTPTGLRVTAALHDAYYALSVDEGFERDVLVVPHATAKKPKSLKKVVAIRDHVYLRQPCLRLSNR